MAGKVRILKEKLFKVKKDDTKLLYVEGACDNDATPPQGNFVTGSAFENVTSGNKYKYSETSGDWILQPSEGGTGGGVLVCNVDDEDALDKTWQEIHDAPFAIVQVDTPIGTLKCPVTLVASSGDEYVILSAAITDSNVGEADVVVDKYIASSANGYPVLQD